LGGRTAVSAGIVSWVDTPGVAREHPDLRGSSPPFLCLRDGLAGRLKTGRARGPAWFYVGAVAPVRLRAESACSAFVRLLWGCGVLLLLLLLLLVPPR
jgi:hypothetical protein